jgi:hypothetical protein
MAVDASMISCRPFPQPVDASLSGCKHLQCGLVDYPLIGCKSFQTGSVVVLLIGYRSSKSQLGWLVVSNFSSLDECPKKCDNLFWKVGLEHALLA